ncbi:MAG: aminoglycoside/hydroxyurea antibiotic resistance kinase [Anaerolineales bacterium]|uniref:aminoglycoside phosphotransferase family protein n=1 Tax=Candidatus Villigracilis proximus TaxID=3140683 RepID=UPI003134AFB0|nr:aminoglycoside/hydroxyurea antibiotic resistance kinase [Anaerolineales bacterium]
MQLPDSFITTIKNVYKKDGENFLAVLPFLIEEVSQRWGLTDVQPVPNLSFNFVAFAKRVSTSSTTRQDDVVLKMGVPNRELTSEMLALKLFNGNGACQLLEYDAERGFLLLERLKPGQMLAEIEDDDERTHIAADVMQKIWRPMESGSLLPAVEQQAVPLHNRFIKLSDWFDGLKKIRPHFGGGTGPIEKELLERVESFLPELFADQDIKLMHGDFHHYNILSSERGWLVIDPKGVIGPAGYEIGPFMLNPWDSFSDGTSFQIKTERRVSILSERLGWEWRKILNWATAHAVLSAWWSVEGNMDSGYLMQCAKIFSELK